MFVNGETGGTFNIINPRTNTVVKSVSLKAVSADSVKPSGIVVSPDGQTVYLGAGRANCVIVLKLATLAVEDTIRVGQRPWGVALTATGKMLFTADGRSNAVSEIDVARRRVIRHISVGDHPYGIAIVSSR